MLCPNCDQHFSYQYVEDADGEPFECPNCSETRLEICDE